MAGLSVEDLRDTPLFSELSRRELGKIAQRMSDRTFPAGTVIAREGEVGVGFFVIEAGRATVAVGGQEVRTIGPGDHFGEIALIVETPRTATITAHTDVRCYGMTSWEFRKLVETNATVAWEVLVAMAHRLLRLEPRLEEPG